MNNTTVNICMQLQFDGLKKWATCVCGVILAVAVFLNGISIWVMKKCTRFPDVIVFQFKNIFVTLTSASFLAIISFIIPLIKQWVTGFEPIFTLTCSLGMTLVGSTLGYSIYSFAFLSFERWMATRTHKHAASVPDLKKIQKYLVGLGITSSVIIALAYNCSGLVYSTEECFCGIPIASTPLSILVLAVLAYPVTDMLIFALLVYVWVNNKKLLDHFSLSTTRYSIIERYHISQTIRTTKMVLIAFSVNNIFLMIISIFILTLKVQYELEGDLESAFWVSICSLFALTFQCIAFPVCLYATSRDMRSKLRITLKMAPTSIVGAQFQVSNEIVEFNITPERNDVIMNNLWAK